MRVIGGIENLSLDRDLEETIVTNVIVHPGYRHTRSTQNDIALLELATPLSQPPATLFLGDRDSLDGLPADIVGWGATFFVTPQMASYPDQLQTAVVPIVPQDVCNAPVSYNNSLIESQFCAGLPEGGVDTCIGDSGGPIYVDVNGVREQVGIVSFGRGCAEPNLYGIYTNVTSYQTWLSQFFTVDKGQPRGPRSEPIVGGQPFPSDGSADDDAEPGSEIRRSGGGSLGLLFIGLLGLQLTRRLR